MEGATEGGAGERLSQTPATPLGSPRRCAPWIGGTACPPGAESLQGSLAPLPVSPLVGPQTQTMSATEKF